MNVAYIRVSTEEQALSGLSHEAQLTACERECERRDWSLDDFVLETASAKDMDGRPAIRALLDRLGEGDVLLVSRLDRLSRSTADFCTILDRAAREGWQVLCLDPAIDMTSPFGRALAQMSAVFAELERALISQRTRDAVAIAKANGTYKNNVSQIDGRIVSKILRMKAMKYGSRRIAAELDLDGEPSPSGGPWSERTVRRVVERAAA